MPTRRTGLGLIGWLLVTAIAAAAGGVASSSAGAFYRQLDRPAWAPPAGLFGPVWTVLYVLMAIAAWRVWMARGWDGARGALTLYLVQLALNALWTWLFFVMRRSGWALAEIVALWVVLVATIIAFGRVDRLAAALLLPYLAWVTYATALTWELRQRNAGRGALATTMCTVRAPLCSISARAST
ncbi:MAG TPA: TspO/MBR family protein [Gemmatimonadaceae bacterium]|nr:TspO/MBR family protein [Gemmatimonadaceae bacterium]